MENVPHTHILNGDETNWKFLNLPLLTWGLKGVDTVNVDYAIEPKDSITAMATVSAAGNKLPLFLITKGASPKCENKIKKRGIETTHSLNGWMNDDTFCQYLTLVRDYYGNYQLIHLIVDIHWSHRGTKVTNHARGLNIILHIIPAGCTDLLQPLDRQIFGPLKSSVRKLFRIWSYRNYAQNYTISQAITHFKCAWDSFSDESVRHSWSIYIGD